LISTESSQLNPLELNIIGSREGKQTSLKIFRIVKSLFYLSEGTCDQQFIVPQKQTKELRVRLAEDFSLLVPFELWSFMGVEGILKSEKRDSISSPDR
jgi:hypothetical protein